MAWNIISPILLSLAIFSQAVCQQPSFTNITLVNGLPSTSLRTIYQDKLGFVWIGTDAKGLCRYDGAHFVTFYSTKSDSTTLSNNFVTSICEDINGNLWIGTEAGLNLYNRKTNTFKRFYTNNNSNNSLIDNKINIVKMDAQGILWVGTDKGLNSVEMVSSGKYFFKNHILPHSPHSFPNSSDIAVNAFYEDKHHNKWFGTKNGLFRYNRSLNKLMYWPSGEKSENGLTCRRIFDIIQRGEIVFLATNEGVFSFKYTEGNEIHFEKLKVELGGGTMKDLEIVKDQLWIATTEDGLFIYPLADIQTNFSNHKIKNTLTNQNVESMVVGSGGEVWLATSTGGIFLYNPVNNIFQFELEGEEVTCLYEDPKGNKWIGTKNKGLILKDGITERTTEVLQSKITNRINYIIKEGDTLFIASNTGLILYDITKNKHQHYRFYKIQCLVSENKKQLLLGTKNGVYYFNLINNTFTALSTKKPQIAQKLNTIITSLIKKGNNLFIGTDSKGLFQYHIPSQSLSHFTDTIQQDGLSSNYIRALFVDRSNKLWIGSKYEGLSCFNLQTKKFRHFNTEQGLSNNSVYAITEDTRGNLWLGTHDGISRFDTSLHIFENYHSINKLHDCVIYLNAAYNINNKKLAFGSKNGLITFLPDSLIRKSKGNFILTSVLINETVILNNLQTDTAISLEHDKNDLIFNFSYINFQNPISNLYYYKLDGVNNAWVKSEKSQWASFSNLPSGSYKFRFGIRNSVGQIEEAPIVITIHIKPFILKSPLAYCLYLITLVLTVYGFIKYLKSRQKMREIDQQIIHFQEALEEKQKFYNIVTQELEKPLINTIHTINNLESYNLPQNTIFNIKSNFKALINALSKIYADSGIKLPLLILHQETESASRLNEITDAANDNFLKKCYKILEENYSNVSFDVSSFSQEIGMSRTNFYNTLKSISGFTPSSMIWEYRLIKAAHLLKTKKETVTEVAYNCGFENISSFSTMFKKKFGKSPSDYKET